MEIEHQLPATKKKALTVGNKASANRHIITRTATIDKVNKCLCKVIMVRMQYTLTFYIQTSSVGFTNDKIENVLVKLNIFDV